MRLEYKPPNVDERIYLDIWCAQNENIIAIELKYKTQRLYVNVKEENFDLMNQSAQDHGRYDFLKDIQRLEQIVLNRNNIEGYAIFLTNDSTYWSKPRKIQTVDSSFRIHHGRILKGELSWAHYASKGTKKGREETIYIKNAYNMNWQDYSEPSQKPYGKFKYLLVKVEGK